jgi:hypothetical protein
MRAEVHFEREMCLSPAAALDRLAGACMAVREQEQALKDFAHSPEFTLDRLLDRLK